LWDVSNRKGLVSALLSRQKMDQPEDLGADSVFLTEGSDTTSAQSKLPFHIFGALTEFERELARERTMAGLRTARERGRVGGRPRSLDEEDIPQVQALVRDEDVSTADICDRFGISKTTLYRYVGPEGESRC
jgi:DNA invertase Pin-like site-specific DNA recombinase